MSTNGELYIGDIDGERPQGPHGGALSVNTGTKREYEEQNFGLWSDVQEYQGDELKNESSSDLTSDEVLENMGIAIDFLEEEDDSTDTLDYTTMYNQG